MAEIVVDALPLPTFEALTGEQHEAAMSFILSISSRISHHNQFEPSRDQLAVAASFLAAQALIETQAPQWGWSKCELSLCYRLSMLETPYWDPSTCIGVEPQPAMYYALLWLLASIVFHDEVDRFSDDPFPLHVAFLGIAAAINLDVLAGVEPGHITDMLLDCIDLPV
jgi:hypothetical protein